MFEVLLPNGDRAQADTAGAIVRAAAVLVADAGDHGEPTAGLRARLTWTRDGKWRPENYVTMAAELEAKIAAGTAGRQTTPDPGTCPSCGYRRCYMERRDFDECPSCGRPDQ